MVRLASAALLVLSSVFAVGHQFHEFFSEHALDNLEILASADVKVAEEPSDNDVVNPPRALRLDITYASKLFGRLPKTTETMSPTNSEELPITELALVLVGVFVDEDVNRARAIIRIDGEERYVMSGANLNDTSKLIKVEKDSIVLEREGVYERLYFEHIDVSKLESQSLVADNAETRLLENETSAGDLEQPFVPETNQQIRERMAALIKASGWESLQTSDR